MGGLTAGILVFLFDWRVAVFFATVRISGSMTVPGGGSWLRMFVGSSSLGLGTLRVCEVAIWE